MIGLIPTALDFDVQPAPLSARAQVLVGDRLMLQESEWLHMTIGPWLAPAQRRIATGAVEYLIQGPTPDDDEEAARAIDRETAALETALRRVDRALSQLDEAVCAEPDVCLATSLLSIRLLLGVCLARADDADAVHLRGERLQLTQWGLEGGVSISQLIGELRTGRCRYIDMLRDTLRRKYRISKEARSAQLPARRSFEQTPLDFRFKRPELDHPSHSSRTSRERPSESPSLMLEKRPRSRLFIIRFAKPLLAMTVTLLLLTLFWSIGRFRRWW